MSKKEPTFVGATFNALTSMVSTNKSKTVDSVLSAFNSTIAELEEVEKRENLKVQQYAAAQTAAQKAYDAALAEAKAGQEAGAKEAERAKNAVERFKALVAGI